MTTISINKFDGGHAEDIRTFAIDQCEKSLHFDLYSNPHLLTPLRNNVTETVGGHEMDNLQISDITVGSYSGNNVLIGVGRDYNTPYTKPCFYIRTTINGDWAGGAKQAIGLGSAASGTAVTYKGLAYTMSTDGQLQKFADNGTVSTVGTASGTGQYVRPFVHPEDNILYIVWGTVISTWDGTTFTNTTTILPTGYECTSLTDYGRYLAIAMRPTNGSGISRVYLWGRDTSINTLQGTINFGDGYLRVIENMDNTLVGILYPTGTFSSTINYKIKIKAYVGGSVETLKSIPFPGGNFNILKVKKDDKLYFAGGGTTGEIAIWCVYKNKSRSWVINSERYMYNGSTVSADTINQVRGLSVIGDFFYIATLDNDSNFRLRATDDSANYVHTSIYKTTVNPSMPIADRKAFKQLQSVQISYTGAASGITVLKYSIDGNDMTTIISDTNATGEKSTEATNENDGIPFLQGREFQFQVETSGGSKIKEIVYKYTKLTTII